MIRKSVSMGILVIMLCPLCSRAEVRNVTLQPSCAPVSEITRVKIVQDAGPCMKATFAIPAEADPDSFRTELAAGKQLNIEDRKYRRVSVSDNPETDTFERRMKKLKDERISVRAAIEGHDAQIQFWQAQTKAKTKTAADASNLAAAIFKNTKKAWQDKLALQAELETIDRKIKELQREIDQTAGSAKTK